MPTTTPSASAYSRYKKLVGRRRKKLPRRRGKKPTLGKKVGL